MKSLINRVSDVYLDSRKSKAGNTYSALVVEFDDGYKFEKPVFGDTDYILNQHANE